MSRSLRKLLHVAINTEESMLEEHHQLGVLNLASLLKSNNIKCVNPQSKLLHLKERNVKHVRIADFSNLSEFYYFGEQLGHGAFGTVVSAVEKSTDKDWAMKIINKSAAGEKLITVKREIQILKMVDHPHIIYLDKVFESAKQMFLILERCYGTLLGFYQEKGRLSESETRKIIRQLSSAVSYLHKHDIVHRDLKLENILTTKNPNDSSDMTYIKVSDFGLSIIKQGRGYEDMLHDYCGTMIYMAPEIITSRSYSQQCDIWAIGIIMYTLLSGQYPFISTNEDDLMNMICDEEPFYGVITASCEATHLIKKMLSKNAALRITAAEVFLHPWITEKSMNNDSPSPENVLDMMRLWRSEMMLPVGEECDWVSSAREAGSQTEIGDKKSGTPKSVPTCSTSKRDITPLPESEERGSGSELPLRSGNESDNSAAACLSRRQSMRLPVKNIRFERGAKYSASKTRTKGTGGSKTCVDDTRTLVVAPAPAPAPGPSRPIGKIETRATRLLAGANKNTRASSMLDKGAKRRPPK